MHDSHVLNRQMKIRRPIVFCAFCLIGIGLALKSQFSVGRSVPASCKLSLPDGGVSPSLHADSDVVRSDVHRSEAGLDVATASGKRLFEQSNDVVKLSILSNGTYQVSMPGRPGEFRTWEGQKPLTVESSFKVPAGVFIKVRNRAGEIFGGGWFTPLIYSSNASFGYIIGQEPKRVDAVGDSGLVNFCDLTSSPSPQWNVRPSTRRFAMQSWNCKRSSVSNSGGRMPKTVS